MSSSTKTRPQYGRTTTATYPGSVPQKKKTARKATPRGQKKAAKPATQSTQAVQSTLPVPTTQESILPNLPSFNIAKILSHFMNFRTIIKDISTALQRLDGFMDSSYKMFKVTQQVVNQARHRKNPFSFFSLPEATETNQKPSKARSADDEEIPVIDIPPPRKRGKNTSGGLPLEKAMENIDFSQIFKMMQSPMFQQMVTNLFKGAKPGATTSTSKKGNAR